MKISVLLASALLASGAAAQAETPGPLTTKETGRLLVTLSHLEACETEAAQGLRSASCDRVRRYPDAAELERKALAWCSQERLQHGQRFGAEVGPHPTCERLGGAPSLAVRLQRLDGRATRP